MRVLFVDDEPQILAGIKRMLKAVDSQLCVSTATDAFAAIEIMKQERVDLLISDMRMPGMSGSELLDIAKRDFPRTVRIILSGEAELELVLKTIGSMHQYLCKPCESSVIQRLVQRARNLHDAIGDPKVPEELGRVTSFPSHPIIFRAIQDELESPDPSLETLRKCVAADAAMTAKVLQLANSGIFGSNKIVVCAEEATELIGISNLRQLVQSSHLLRTAAHKTTQAFVVGIADHSWRTAVLARQIAKSESLSEPVIQECFTGGILHDVGKIVLADYLNEEYLEVVAASQCSQHSLLQMERETCGIGHDQVAGLILALWGLPERLADTALLHHSPEAHQCEQLSPPAIVYAANRLLHERYQEETGNPTPGIPKANLPHHHYRRWRQLLPSVLRPRK